MSDITEPAPDDFDPAEETEAILADPDAVALAEAEAEVEAEVPDDEIDERLSDPEALPDDEPLPDVEPVDDDLEDDVASYAVADDESPDEVLAPLGEAAANLVAARDVPEDYDGEVLYLYDFGDAGNLRVLDGPFRADQPFGLEVPADATLGPLPVTLPRED